jgi:hypothetical protein
MADPILHAVGASHLSPLCSDARCSAVCQGVMKPSPRMLVKTSLVGARQADVLCLCRPLDLRCTGAWCVAFPGAACGAS